MAKYIERSAVLKELMKEYRECSRDGEENGGEAVLLAEGIYSAYETIKSMPIADVVPVVRCRDCKHYKADADEGGWGLCNNTGIGQRDIDFCSDGERKEER